MSTTATDFKKLQTLNSQLKNNCQLHTARPRTRVHCQLYKTGDMARWLSDGNLEFSGRIDHQVKIRGFRIEPGEIETQLLKHEAVKEAVVIAGEDKHGGKYLCAYVVTGGLAPGQRAGEEELTVQDLRDFLAKTIPDYMIPSYFVQLKKLPLTPNGKIDRKALPEPEPDLHSRIEYEAPGNEVEQRLAFIWEELLGIEKIGVHDNFFEIGGNSLSIIRLQVLLEADYPNRIRVVDLFTYPTVFKLAQYINRQMAIENEPPVKLHRNPKGNDLEREINQMFDALEEGKIDTGQFVEKMMGN